MRKTDNLSDSKNDNLNGETKNKTIPVLGITGTGGAGKSSVTDEIVRRFLNAYDR